MPDATLLSRNRRQGDGVVGTRALRIVVGADQGGYEQKDQLAAWLRGQGHQVHDVGTNSAESVDYPDYARAACNAVAAGQADFGILVCGTGIGMQIAANKVRGIRAANVTSPQFACLAREHNDANVLTLSGRFVSLEANKAIVEAFLSSSFAGGRHARRVAKVMNIEKEG